MRFDRRQQPVSTSVVVVSRGRPEALRRCILSLWLQDHPEMEVIVVADRQGLCAVADLPFADRLKTCQADQPGISDARNRGVSRAAGDVVAFLDDDSAAFPDWATRLSEVFSDPAIRAATGFVLGRNGVTLQWGGASVDRSGQDTPVAVPFGAGAHVPEAVCVKLLGTNMAIRRADLRRIGGFDGGYRYYMDDTDLSLRVGCRSGRTAIVAEACVQHDFLANDSRRADRAPTDLTEIGASCAYFLRRHCPPTHREGALRGLRREMKRRALRHMVSGALEPGEIDRLLCGFDRGVRAGASRRCAPSEFADATSPEFVPLRSGRCNSPGQTVLGGTPERATQVCRDAIGLAAEGQNVLVRISDPWRGEYCRQFTDTGFWLETGVRAKALPLNHFLRYNPFRRAGNPRSMTIGAG